jgi:hypothetical protein
MRPMTEAEKDMAIEGVNKTLRRLGIEPWKDGRSLADGKRPWEHHVGMVLLALVTEIEDLKRAIKEAADVPQYIIRNKHMPPAKTIKPEARAVLEVAEVHLKSIIERMKEPQT